MTATVDEQELLQLSVGDFIAVLTHNMGDGKSHWTLGSVETPPFRRDVEVRLWEKQKDEEYNENDLPSNEETEQLMKRIAEVKGELQKSIDEADALTEQLRARRASIVKEIGEADEYVAESRAIRDAARDDVESIPDRHWNELKSYRVPPKMVSLVIRAVMLLLSEDEARTWPQMQRVLRDFNFKSRITSYDPEQQLSPERREYILQECVSKKSFRYDRAMQGSVAVGPIYYWVLAQLDSGEAQSNKTRVDKEKVARQKELRRVMKQLSEQQARIAEYQTLMDDLDDQLRRCREQSLTRSSGGAAGGGSVSRSRLRSLAAARYENSFAGEQQKEYLRPAFYSWRPTERVIIVLRKNIICNFGATTTQEQQEGYNMSEPQVRMLDDELLRRQAQADAEDEEARKRREAEEERQLENDMFAQNAAEQEAHARDDEEILKERERAAAEGKPTPTASPMNDNEATDRLQRKFEGKNWQKILDRKRDAIVSTFTEESAECLDVPDYYVSIHDLTLGSLIVDFDVTHDGKRDTQALQSAVDSFDYPKMKALYEEEDEVDEEDEEMEEEVNAAPQHQMKFGGGRWADIVPYHRAEILDAFLTDTGNATSLPRNDIQVLDARVEEAEGLTVDYTIHNNELTAEEVQDLVDRFDYPCVWALYQQLAGLDEAGPLHQVRFRGERWESLLAANQGAIANAFTLDTANALDVTQKQIQTEDMRYERGLTVPYTVTGCSLSEDDIDEKVEEYKYPETWALYDRLVAEACGANYQRAFDGVYWEAVLSEARPALTDAFRTDSATALDVPVEKVEACSLDTDQDRLLVSFNVVDDTVEASKVRDETKGYEYPETWALYGQTVQDQQEAVSNMERTFDGASWGAMVQEKEDAIKKAFTQDVCEQVDLPPEAVTVHSLSTDDYSMTVKFGVQQEGVLEYDVKKALEDCAYPNTWDLYEELSEEELKRRGLGGGSGESGILERRFDGDDWDILVDGCPDDLRSAFVSDTAKCLGTSKSNVRVLSTEIGSLVVNYQIIEPDYDDEEIARRVEEHDYEELMGLYKRRLRSGGDGEEGGAGRARGANDVPADAPTEHAMSFEGGNWDEVMRQKGDEVKEAIREDAANALGIPVEEVEGVEASTTADGLEAKVTVAPQDGQNADKMCDMWDALHAREFPKTWSVYDAVPESDGVIPADAPTVHAMSFEGDNWDEVMQQKGDEVKEAIRADAANALGIPAEDVEEVQATAQPDALEAVVTIAPQEGQSKETMQPMWDALDADEFPQTWSVYDASEVPTEHQVRFEGEDWATTMEQKEDQVRQVFIEETAEVCGVEPEKVKDVSFATNDQGTTASFTVEHPSDVSASDLTDRLIAAEYPKTWSLYEEMTVSSHDHGFEGEDWDYVWSTKEEAVKEAFANDVATRLGTKPEDVANITMQKITDGIVLSSEIKHPVSLPKEEVDAQLKDYKFGEMWMLYEPRPYDPNETIETKHVISFEGEAWGYVMDHKTKEVHAAVRGDTATALKLEPENVLDVKSAVDATSLEVTITVKHSPLQDTEIIQEELASYDYEHVWALYCPPDEAPVATRHFEGEHWDAIVDAGVDSDNAAIKEAFANDTSRALNSVVEDVEVREIRTDAEGMTVEYAVQFCTSPPEEVEEMANNYPYPQVWALYKPMESSRAVPEPHRKNFPGDNWDPVLEGNRQALDDAFKKDTAEALGVSAENVEVTSIYTTPEDGMTVNYRVNGDDAAKVPGAEMDKIVNDCAHPSVWDLYQIDEEAEVDEEMEEEAEKGLGGGGDRESGILERRFEGDDWDILLDGGCRPELDDAFQTGAARSLGVPKPNVVVVDAQIGSLMVNYKVRGCPDEDDEIDRKVQEEEFPELMELYRRRIRAAGEGDDGASNSRGVVGPKITELAVSFDGEDWDYVLEKKSQAVAAAFKEETAAALSVTERDVTITEFVLGSLLVQFKVRHDGTVADEQLSRKIDAYPYEKVWALYEDRPTGAPATRALNNAAAVNRVSSVHEVGFEAPNWEYVDRVRHEQILAAFATAAAKACKIDQGDVQGAETTVYPNMMKVTATILHPASLSTDAVNDAMDAYSFDEVWSLYEDEEVGHETKTLSKTFEGDDWAPIVQSSRSAVSDAFRADTSACLNIPRASVTVRDVKAGSLIVEYTVRVPREYSEADVERLTDVYPYPEVWKLYKPRGGVARSVAERADGSAAPSQRVFKGPSWDIVVEKQRAELKKAFIEDTAAAVGTSEDQVDLISLYTTEGGLVMNHHTEKSGMSQAEVDRAVHESDYARVWALYRLYADEGYVTTEHGVGFDGEDWDYVLEKNCQTLTDTFVMCTAEQLGLQSRHITGVVVNLEPDNTGVALTLNVSHPRHMTKSAVDHKLEECAYDPVWQLYETRPYDPKVKVVSAHEIRFEGEDWGHVVERKRAQVHTAFVADVAEAMHLEPADVHGVRIEKTETGIVMGCNVTHSPLQDDDMIQEELERHEFMRVWNLYEPRPFAATSDHFVTAHQVGFEGDRWLEVMSHRRAKVLNAIRVDTAAALQLTPEDILEVTTDEQADIMICSVVVQHPREQTEDTVQEQISQYDYDRVWALYDDTIAPRVDVLKNRANSRMTGLMTKRFDGVDWDLALEEYPEKVREAFITDTAEVLQCAPAQVVVDGVAIGSLIVQYRVRDLDMTERKATQLTDNYAYPNVWALYKSRTDGSTSLSASRSRPSGTRAPPAPIRDSTGSVARSSVPSAAAQEREANARREAEAARKAAEEARRKEAEAAAAARKAQDELDAAEEEARRAEEEAFKALERAKERRASAAAAAAAAQAEEDVRAQQALEEAERAVAAARRADEAAEEARKRSLPPPLETGETEDEQESLAYLRKALADARRERDEYQDELERANARHKNLDGMHKEVTQMRKDTPPASRPPAAKKASATRALAKDKKQPGADEYDEY